MAQQTAGSMNIGALKIRIGFWGPSYLYFFLKEPPKIVLVVIQAPILLVLLPTFVLLHCFDSVGVGVSYTWTSVFGLHRTFLLMPLGRGSGRQVEQTVSRWLGRAARTTKRVS